MRRARIALWLAIALLGAAPQPQTAPLPVEVAVGAKAFPWFSRLAISPDGVLVAYALQDGKRMTEAGTGPRLFTATGATIVRQGCDVMLTDLNTGKTVDLTGGMGTSWDPVWSSDGSKLAFLSDSGGNVHLWLWDRVRDEKRQVSDAIVHQPGGTAIAWVQNDTKVLAPLLPEGTGVADADDAATGYVVRHAGQMTFSRSTIRVYANDPAEPGNESFRTKLQSYDGNDNGDPYDYSVVDVASGSVVRLLPRSTALSVSVSDDQRYVLFLRAAGSASDKRDDALYDIDVVSLADGKLSLKLRAIPMSLAFQPAWRPRHDSFVYTTGARYADMATARDGAMGESYLVSVPSGKREKLTSGKHPMFGLYDQSLGWAPDGNRLYYVADQRLWVTRVGANHVRPVGASVPSSFTSFVYAGSNRVFASGSAIYALTQDGTNKKQGIVAIDTRTGKAVASFAVSQDLAGYDKGLIVGTPEGSVITYVAQDSTHPWDIWRIGPSLRDPRRLTQLNPELERYRYRASRLLAWTAPDGERGQGVLLLPPDYVKGRRYPTIVYQYPGEAKSDALNVFGGDGATWGNYQLLVTRGFAVFMPDMVWKNSAEADVTNGRAMRWLNSALDALVEAGISDPNRFGIEGASNGGYGTLAFITQTKRFRAAIDDSGPESEISTFTEFLQNGDAFYVTQEERSVGGTPWTNLKGYVAMSPFFKFDRIATPLMIVQGSATPWIQQKQGDATFVALRRLNKEVLYVLYLGEGHTHSNFSYEHSVDYWNRAIAWYVRWLKTPRRQVQ